DLGQGIALDGHDRQVRGQEILRPARRDRLNAPCPLGLPDFQPARADRLQVLSAREHPHLVAGARDRAAEVSADPSGSHDGDSHEPIVTPTKSEFQVSGLKFQEQPISRRSSEIRNLKRELYGLAARSRTYLQAGQVWNSATTPSKSASARAGSAPRSIFSACRFIRPPQHGQRILPSGETLAFSSPSILRPPARCFRARSAGSSPSRRAL